jgi:LuxR family maltose regulon positive regulatory protein
LIERLNLGIDGKLTLIAAPAGFGKSSLLTAWAAASDRPIAWLSLDASDNDLNRFLAYLIAAIQSIHPGFGQQALELLNSPPPVLTEPVLTLIINAIAGLAAPMVLVLDDYHLIQSNDVHTVLDFLLDHLPPSLHLVLATREDPALAIARLRARGQLTELRADDLRFNFEETHQFLSASMGLSLSPDQIELLERRSEGWIAALQLAGLALQNTANEKSDATARIDAFSGTSPFVLDYLVEEVIEMQPKQVQDFLLRTAILERISAPLCASMLGSTDSASQEILEALERANLLLIPLDADRTWFRYHHLFAEALRSLLHSKAPAEVRGLHRAAGEWFQQQDMLEQAIHHRLSADEFEQAADLIELNWSDVRRNCFRSPTWLGWVQDLPEAIVECRPVLSVGYLWELLAAGDIKAAATPLRSAERWLEPKPVEPGEDPAMTVVNQAEFPLLPAALATAKSMFAQAQGDIASTQRHARRALVLIGDIDPFTKGIASSMLGMACWAKGDLDTAFQAISDSISSLQEAGNRLFAFHGTYYLANLREAQGLLHEVEATYLRAIDIANSQGEPIIQGLANVHLGLAELHLERGDRQTALEHMQRSQEMGQPAATPDWRFRLALTQARLLEHEGDWNGALAQLDEAERHYFQIPVPQLRVLPAWRAQLWIRQGNLEPAQSWLRDQQLSIEDDLVYLKEFEYVTLVRLFIAQFARDQQTDSLRQALILLRRLLDAAENDRRIGSIIELSLLQAVALQAQGSDSAALKAIQRALGHAEPQGFIRPFQAELGALRTLMKQAVQADVLPAYADRVLADPLRRPEPASLPRRSSAVLAEPLSARELEVLQLVAQGLSNRQISERLYLALNTVKGHNRNIFAKLEVNRRTEAVAKARALGLIE